MPSPDSPPLAFETPEAGALLLKLIGAMHELVADMDARIDRQRKRVERMILTSPAIPRVRPRNPELEELRDVLTSMIRDRELVQARLIELQSQLGD